jgi:hypothetical protein
MARGTQVMENAFIKTDIVNLVAPRGLKTLGTASSNKMFLQLGARTGRIGDKRGKQFSSLFSKFDPLWITHAKVSINTFVP